MSTIPVLAILALVGAVVALLVSRGRAARVTTIDRPTTTKARQESDDA